MKQLRILILFLIIYSIAFLAFSFTFENVGNKRHFNVQSGLKTRHVHTGNKFFPVLDTLEVIPSNEFPVTSDSTELKKSEPEKISTDTIGLINTEPLILLPDDSLELVKPLKIIPADTIGIPKPEIYIPVDSLEPFRENIPDSLRLLYEKQSDTNQRIRFRSVYMDSIEQGNPRFSVRKIIMIKWITEKRDTVIRYKNLMGLNVFYGVYTYGFGYVIFKRLSNDADFFAGVNLSYAFDRRTSDDIDTNTGIFTLQKESRMYPIVFNVGLEKYFMQNRVDWKVKPVLIFGFAPAIIPVAPYELSFFSSFKKLQLAYGLGVFAAFGFDWQPFQKFGINLTARYSFIPVIAGKDIYYYKGFHVKNIGGFYVNLGFTLLREYFGKK